MSAHARDRSRLDWLDRYILPAGTPIAPSRWHEHVQRRLSRLDHLRPHRLNWDALKHPELAAEQDDASLTRRRVAGIRWSWLDGLFTTISENLYLGFVVLYALAYGGGWLADTYGFHVIFGASGAAPLLGTLLFVWLAVWPALGARGGRPAGAPASAT